MTTGRGDVGISVRGDEKRKRRDVGVRAALGRRDKETWVLGDGIT